MNDASIEEKAEYKQVLLNFLPKQSTVYLVLRHLSKSRMQREFACYVVRNGDICEITSYVRVLLGLRWGQHDGAVVRGTGMDMGFWLVSEVGMCLYADGNALKHRLL